MTKPKQIKCSNCQATVDDGNFCTECGAEFEKELKCPNCKTIVKSSSKFCGSCGEELNFEEVDEELKCSKCDSIVEEDDKFCQNCGEKFD